ncbi:MAG: relaxase/mobilization nuclease domain-containing protein [Bacteroidota bacterium]
MVAIIKSSGSLRNVLHYNENKVKQHQAELIHSNNYLKHADQLSLTDKIRTLEKLNSLNERTKLKTVHISLNFDPSEKLQKEVLQQIADRYMEQIGFGEQPYLVYQHHDAGHPHLHIVSTNIQKDGSRIKMQNIGRNQSEKARKQIEQEFKLVQAGKQQLSQRAGVQPLVAQRVQYGKTETRRAISNVLSVILPHYKYTSMPELNAILQQYNILADRGKENSRIFKNNGLVYRILNEHGEKIGTPIKASAINNNAGMQYLEARFKENEILKQRHKLHVKNTIELLLRKQANASLAAFAAALKKEQVMLVQRQNVTGLVYGLTFIDVRNKCVFNGSDIGKEYSAASIMSRLGISQQQHVPFLAPTATDGFDTLTVKRSAYENMTETKQTRSTEKDFAIKEIIKPLTAETNESLAYELRQEQTRKRKKKLRQ